MFHPTDFGGFLVCCYKAIQQLNGFEKNSVGISLMLNHNLTGLRVRARENHMKPFVRTSFLGTRPSCSPFPGRQFFCTDDRTPNLWLGLPGSPVIIELNESVVYTMESRRWTKSLILLIAPIPEAIFLVNSSMCRRFPSINIPSDFTEVTFSIGTLSMESSGWLDKVLNFCLEAISINSVLAVFFQSKFWGSLANRWCK